MNKQIKKQLINHYIKQNNNNLILAYVEFYRMRKVMMTR